MGFVFYDLETTGLDPKFDQILELAAIHTDGEFRELDRLHAKCRLRPHIIPSIKALSINGFSIERCTDDQLPSHYEMMRTVNETFLRWSPSIFVGGNSISFDEEFLRFALYQSLTESFLTSCHGNARLDLMWAAGAISRFSPEALRPAFTDKGNLSLALERVAAANGVSEHRAHDAISDTEAMVQLAGSMRSNAPIVWSQALRMSKKFNARTVLETGAPFVLTEVFSGRIDQYVVVPLRPDPADTTGNRWICADLDRDFSQFADMSDAEAEEWLTTSPRPLRSVKVNRSPMILPLEELDEFNGIDMEDYIDRSIAIRDTCETDGRAVALFSAATQSIFENSELEQQLYEGWCDESQWQLINKFHELPWAERLDHIKRIPDRRYQRLGLRLIAEHAAQVLDDDTRARLDQWIKSRFDTDLTSSVWRTKLSAKQEAHGFRLEHPDTDYRELCASYSRFIESLP